MAALYARGELSLDTEYINEGKRYSFRKCG